VGICGAIRAGCAEQIDAELSIEGALIVNESAERVAGVRGQRKPEVSVVVVVYNIAREAPRTLLSLSSTYQQNIEADEYEVIVIDNGSNPPFDRRILENLSGNFRLIRIDPASPSPAQAVNRGIAEARGEIIGVMIDGARIVTPGLLHFARHGARLYDTAVVATLGWYLGFDFQRWAMQAGYDRSREDALLASIEWPQDGYRLFEVATLDESSVDGWLQPLAESNALFLHRKTWKALGGVEERFDEPSGAYLNLDTYRRAIELPGANLVILLGEATFHQLHGGFATNVPMKRLLENSQRWQSQYWKIRGELFRILRPKIPPTYLGVLPQPVLTRLVRAAIDPVAPGLRGVEPPLGVHFDKEFWSVTPIHRPSNRRIAAVLDLAHNEFRAGNHQVVAALCRLIRQYAPDEPEPQRLLTLVSGWHRLGDAPAGDSNYHLVLHKAYLILREPDKAAAEYKAALTAHAKIPISRMLWRRFLALCPWAERVREVLRRNAIFKKK
jgi:glycosyltransferase involved in cell wall biosynthesis